MQNQIVLVTKKRTKRLVMAPVIACCLFVLFVVISGGSWLCAATLSADYHFDECEYTGVGNEIVDDAGNRNARAVGGFSTNDSGVVNRYADFSKNTEGGLISKSFQLSANWTISVWLKMPFISTQYEHTLASVDGESDLIFFHQLLNYNWWVFIRGDYSRGKYTLGNLSDGWHHIAVVGSAQGRSGRTSLYVDGQYKDSVGSQAKGKLKYIGTSYYNFGTSEALGIGLPLDEFMVFKGALSPGEISTIYNNQRAGKNYDGTPRAAVNCGSDIDHFEIVHDGSALTCAPEEIKLVACQSADCSAQSTTSATVTLSPTGWQGGDQITFTGSRDLKLQHTSAGTVTLGLTDPASLAANGYKCVRSVGGADVGCNLEFSDSGFDFSIPTQVSGKTSQPVTISAVKKNDTGTTCVPAFADRTETINFWSTYVSPANGTMPMQIGADDISTGSPGTGVELVFDSNGQSSFTVKYADAGQLQLDASFSGTGDEAGLTMTGNANFITHPAGLCVYSDDTDSDCGSADGSCSKFVAAGKPFNLKVKGVSWQSDTETDSDYCDNPATPNYVHSGISITHNLVAPTSGVPGNIDIETVDITSGGEARIDQIVSEVGVFTFTADPPADYLGAGDVFPGTTYTSENTGRFPPDHFDVSILPDPPVFKESCTVYTYLGEPFDWDSVPDLTITAMNGATTPAITQNYEADFWKLDKDLKYSYVDTTAPAGAAPLTPANSSQTMGDTGDCNGTMTIPLVEDDGIAGNGVYDGFNYSRPAHDSPVSPFEPDVTMSVPSAELTDSDSVCYDTGSGCINYSVLSISGIHLRHGRALAEAVYGPETQPLVMPVRTYWYDGSDWLKNDDDDCSTFNFTSATTGPTVTFHPTSPVTMAKGKGDLTISRVGGANSGTVTVDFDFPDWLHPGPDPSAEATFGISRGNDRILNWQEISR